MSQRANLKPWPQQKCQYTTRVARILVMAYVLLSGRCQNGRSAPQGDQKRGLFFLRLYPVKHSQLKHFRSVMCFVCCFIPSFRSYWRNKASWIPSAERWASGSSWGRERGITSASGSIASKAVHRPLLHSNGKTVLHLHRSRRRQSENMRL